MISGYAIDQEINVSFVVVSLLASAPTTLALQVTKKTLDTDSTILERKNPSVDNR